MTRIATALVLALSLLACKHDECSIDFDHGDDDKNTCEAVGQIVDCIEERHELIVDVADEDVEDFVTECMQSLAGDWCVTSSNDETAVRFAAIDEIRGETNDCIGDG